MEEGATANTDLEIEFVNHSGFVVEHGGVRLMCDPWLDGRAFNQGWALLSPTRFRYEDFAHITHIWFSHEHPDHFSPPNLKAIPEEIRSKIVVLYQQTADHKVAGFCRKLGFADVIELSPDGFHELEPGFEVLCRSHGKDDSWLCVRTSAGSILNLNDCMATERAECEAIRRAVGDVDVVFTQYSISAWDGNEEELDRRRAGALEMLDRTVLHVDVFKPRFVVPFASFVWFCHEDNAFMNDAHNRIADVVTALSERTAAEPVVLYPGDRWRPGTPHDSSHAIARYTADEDSVPGRELVPSTPVSLEDLLAAGERFQAWIFERASRLRLRVAFARRQFDQALRDPTRSLGSKVAAALRAACLRIAPARVHLHDLGLSFTLDFFRGLRLSELSAARCDVITNSESLHYALCNAWGGETLQINGLFREVRPDGRLPLLRLFWVAGGMNAGARFGWADLPRALADRVRIKRSA